LEKIVINSCTLYCPQIGLPPEIMDSTKVAKRCNWGNCLIIIWFWHAVGTLTSPCFWFCQLYEHEQLEKKVKSQIATYSLAKARHLSHGCRESGFSDSKNLKKGKFNAQSNSLGPRPTHAFSVQLKWAHFLTYLAYTVSHR